MCTYIYVIVQNWSPYSGMVWACGRKLLQYDQESEEAGRSDIATKMKQRAINGYGLKVLYYLMCYILCASSSHMFT